MTTETVKEHAVGQSRSTDGLGAWISVNNRLPEPETDVLCAGTFGVPLFVAALFEGKWESFIDGGEKAREVTHWMPLPEAPNDAGERQTTAQEKP